MDDFFLGPVSSQARSISILGTLSLAIIIVGLIKRGVLRSGYSILWFLMVGAMLILSLSPTAVFLLSSILGVFYAPAALFAVLFVILILISVHFSVVLSTHERRIKRLVQEIGLLKKDLEDKRNSKKAAGTHR